MIPSGSLVVLDTNVLVHLIRQDQIGEHLNQQYQLTTRAERPLISIVTVGECYSLVAQLNWGAAKQDKLADLFHELVVVDINTSQILNAYAEIDSQSRAQGRRMGKNDAWIAATTKASDAWLLTCDKDFDHLHPTLINRVWEDPDQFKP